MFITRDTIVEISPVLVFAQKEYETHGKHTILDHYTFKWTDGRMALALGLGSLFNHSENPNMSYILERQTDCIKYIAARDIQPDEELCIFYGHNLWFVPITIQGIENESSIARENRNSTKFPTVGDDEWGGLLGVNCQDNQEIKNPYLQGDPNEITPQEALPFTKIKPPSDEEDSQSIRTMKAWAVDIPDARHIATLLQWMRQASLDTPDLGHLKRIRKQNNLTTFLISSCTSDDDTIEPPSLPPLSDPKQNTTSVALPPPYIISVPASSALTPGSLALKSALWPTNYTPRRKDEAESWTRGKLRWAWDAMKLAIDAASKAAAEQQLPIAAHIPAPYDLSLWNSSNHGLTFTASDTRRTTRNPLRHSILNLIRKIAERHIIIHSSSAQLNAIAETPRNGTNYLLTDQTVFITHEPCIMCSMALLHSRVKEVVYLYPMPKTGGCGGCTCLPALKGVNHRFGILEWRFDKPAAGFCENDMKIGISDTVDA